MDKNLDKGLLQGIVESVFKTTPASIEEIKGKGKNNLVFKVSIENTPYILRINKNLESKELYEKEKWCSDIVREKGILTPKILTIGVCSEYAFSLQEFIEGKQGMEAKEESVRIWRELGKYARVFNFIPAPHIAVNYHARIADLFSDEYFVKRDIFTPKLSQNIQDRLKEMTLWKFSPTLCHGNLHPSNIIINTEGIFLIDWETATGNYNPASELAEIYTRNTGKENITHFLEGYGLEDHQVKIMMRDIQTLVLLRLVDVIKRKISKSKGEEWKEDSYIKETAIKLSGIEDFKQDILFTKNL
jgi:thiamine kinase-like enzyme